MLALAVSTLVLVGVVVPLSTSPVAKALSGSEDAADLAAVISDRISGAAIVRQDPDGLLPDYVKEALGTASANGPRNRYGPAIMGAGLVLNGARNSRPDVVSAGVRSIRAGNRTGEGFLSRDPNGRTYRNSQYPFSMLGVVSAWRSIDRRESSSLGIDLADWRMMRRIIRLVAPIPTASDPARLVNGSNRILLERLVWLEVIGSGVRPLPKGSSSILRRPRATSIAASEWFENWISSRPLDTRGSEGPVSFISDAPAWPNAYQALSSALVARAIRVTKPPLSSGLRLLLRRAVRAARQMASPDGDLAWAGRSNLQSWSLAMMAYSALEAAADPRTSKAESGRNRSFALSLLRKLQADYLRPDGRISLVPGLTVEPVEGLRGLDWYAAEIPYTGLTLLGLEWAARVDATGPLESEIPPSTVLWPGIDGATLGILRTPDLWVGLRGASRSWVDARLDSGPIAAKQLVGGTWRWLLHPPPAIPAIQPPSWLSTPSGLGGLSPVRVVGLTRRPTPDGESISIPVEFTQSGARTELAISGSGCGGMAISSPSLPEPLFLSLWLPSPGVEGISGEVAEVYFDEGRVSASGATTVTVGPPQPGSSHPFMSQVSFGFEPEAAQMRLDICLDHPLPGLP